MPSKPTAAVVKQQVEDHVDECAQRYQQIEKRLWRMEMIMIGGSSSIIMLLLKIIFF